MECTQRLECTQELYDTHTERTCPEQIGFLGICGTKYPVLKGPNKIGRDPQTCNIVLNLNSISRQHAVINILNSREFMLMDLGSANKTKLENKTLQAYIPNPLRNGDMVQFGDIFGVFRLLEDDDELPMTQAIDIPETPAPIRPNVKFNKAPITLIPESPDVSDKEDSFITLAKDRKSIDTQQKLSNSQYITPFGKTLSIHPVSSPKADSKQTRRSSSISFIDNPNTSLNESLRSTKPTASNDIHEMDTQAPGPIVNESNDSIYTADTQVPEERGTSPSIHSLDTQIPGATPDHLPQVRKINNQQEMHFDLYAANKENDTSIFNAETQPFPYNVSIDIKKADAKDQKAIVSPSKKKVNALDEEVIFDEIDGESFDEDFYSQAILPPVLPFVEENEVETKLDLAAKDDMISKTSESKQRNNGIKSDESTDCEDDLVLPVNKNIKQKSNAKAPCTSTKSGSSTDCEDFHIMPTQKIVELPLKNDDCEIIQVAKTSRKPSKRVNRIDSDSSTDCEDMIPTQKLIEKKADKDDDLTDCEDDFIVLEKNKSNKTKDDAVKFEEMATQVLEPVPTSDDFQDMPTQVIDGKPKCKANSLSIDVDINDAPTQILDEIVPIIVKIEKPLKVADSPFKIPLHSSVKLKPKDISKLTANKKSNESNCTSEDIDNFYASTQDIYQDLCSQRGGSPEILSIRGKHKSPKSDEVVPCSVEDYVVGDRFANIDKDLSTKYVADKSSSSDGDERAKKYVGNLSSQQVREIIGVKNSVKKPKRMPSDSSDVDKTPKKARPIKFADFDLPNSQEIKTSVTAVNRVSVSVSSSESEMENSEEQYTPILHRKKKSTTIAKIDLTKKFEIEKLPQRVITRVRKPTVKVAENKGTGKNILKPKFLTEQEEQIDKDIIIENIIRLKNKDKTKVNPKDEKVEVKGASKDTQNSSEKKSESQKGSEKKTASKEKIKVKIEKPKKKEKKHSDSTRKSREDSKKRSIETTQDLSESTQTSRTTRSRKRASDTKITNHNKTESPVNIDTSEIEVEGKRTRSNRSSNKKEEKKEERISPEIVVRRSKRQQTKDKTEPPKKEQPKSILKNSMHEHSTVYNVSSSSTEIAGLKRSAIDDSDVPSPKRTRSVVNTSNVSLRATPARVTTHHVLFTAFPCEEVKHKLEKLGAVIVTDVTACTVVLTMQIKRTFKLLCAVGLGRPIVGPSWVQACVDTHMIVDPWLYLMRDEAAEKRFQFNLQKSLSGRRKYLQGYNISSTPSVQPNATEMKLIVECSGGTWKEEGPNWICVSSSHDKALWPSLRRRGAAVVSTEFILGGVLRQKLDIAANKFN